MRRPTQLVYRFCIGLGLIFFRLLRLRRSMIGAEHLPASGGAVLAITHFGYLDFGLTEWMVWVARRRLVRFMVTRAAWDHPVSGPLLKAMQHIPVNRRAGHAAYEMAVAKLRAGELVGVFPEAQVNLSWTVRSLKTGTVRMAAEAGVPIIPVIVWGGHRVITKKHKPRLREAFGAAVTFTVGEPVHVDPATDVQVATGQLHALMQGLVDQAQAAYPQPAPDNAWWMPAHLGGAAPTAAEVEPDLDRPAAPLPSVPPVPQPPATRLAAAEPAPLPKAPDPLRADERATG